MKPYRAIPIDGKDFVYGYFFPIWCKTYILWGTTNDIPNMTQVIPETVGQQIGLQGKNGKEIYEGDIVIIGCYHLKAVIEYEHSGFVMHHVKGSKRRKYCANSRSEPIFLNCNISVEIIGNIHQNPKLLEKSK